MDQERMFEILREEGVYFDIRPARIPVLFGGTEMAVLERGNIRTELWPGNYDEEGLRAVIRLSIKTLFPDCFRGTNNSIQITVKAAENFWEEL